ncbi:(deoxy)nucleoside triphosphate pyrophosphohydrolase [Pontibacter harenae]|uniref:(deoxy)nucleoside triphosphate pyrophosphohydrolase n=1 Tax=Pontibacter harenae TaxID=2894083 RepID=UPI001E50A7C7|nr:(deoxy)nucleoside triphosphate pyrophosphohydrolase [Pontibacter harenae]MCC9167069.1 (deoxy)nucleoside triphosphate pyrophosphohydrolase [Pontibacter harenae]
MGLKVTCAIVEQNDRVLVTQRNKHMSQAMLWEFPGGKLEIDETEKECVRRELKEELQIEVEPIHQLAPVEHTYSDKDIILIPFVCQYTSGNVSLAEHNAYQWAELSDLTSYDWCPADIPVVEQYLQFKASMSGGESA